MKKVSILFLSFAIAISMSVTFTGCKSNKQAAGQSNQSSTYQPQPPKQEFEAPPCFIPDDDFVFAGSSSAYGAVAQEAVVRRSALVNAQNIARQKMKHAYQGMVSDYMNLIGENSGQTARSNIERAGDQMIDVIVNATREKCILRSKTPDEKGNITYYIGIEINKAEAVDQISDALDKDKETGIRFHEYNYREKMKENFKNFRETQKK
jgi:hypothetical protein